MTARNFDHKFDHGAGKSLLESGEAQQPWTRLASARRLIRFDAFLSFVRSVRSHTAAGLKRQERTRLTRIPSAPKNL